MKFFTFDGESSIYRRCAGCGEIIRYLDIVAHDAETDEWWHEGCAPEVAS